VRPAHPLLGSIALDMLPPGPNGGYIDGWPVSSPTPSSTPACLRWQPTAHPMPRWPARWMPGPFAARSRGGGQRGSPVGRTGRNHDAGRAGRGSGTPADLACELLSGLAYPILACAAGVMVAACFGQLGCRADRTAGSGGDGPGIQRAGHLGIGCAVGCQRKQAGVLLGSATDTGQPSI